MKKDEEQDEDGVFLFDADPECDHIIESKWSGIECKKCGGWFCF